MLTGVFELKLISGSDLRFIMEMLPYVVRDLVVREVLRPLVYNVIMNHYLDLAKFSEDTLGHLGYWIRKCAPLHQH